MMISDVHDYFEKGCGRCARFATPDCAAQIWSRGLADLRGICLASGLSETAKWGHPCYMHAGRNIVILGAFQSDFRLSFFDAALLRDADQILERPGSDTRHADMVRFTSNDGPAAKADVIRAYLEEAKSHAEAGRRPPKDDDDLVWPDELASALDADPALAEAFHALTRGRQKSYIIHLKSSKNPQTRVRRIEKARDRILSGKGAQER